MPPRETHLGSLGLSKVTSKWSENDTKRHFGNWWRPHWANPIIYYVFGGSLLEKRIIYYVLACSKKLIFMKLYKNLIMYYVLKPPKKSASPKSRPIGCPPLPQTPSPWDTPFCTQRPSQDSESPSASRHPPAPACQGPPGWEAPVAITYHKSFQSLNSNHLSQFLSIAWLFQLSISNQLSAID